MMQVLNWLKDYPEQFVLISGILSLCVVSRFFSQIITLTVLLFATYFVSLHNSFERAYQLYLIGLLYLALINRLWLKDSNGIMIQSDGIFILIWAIAGHFVLVQQNWLSFYIGIELGTIPFYALISRDGSFHQSSQVVMNYFMQNTLISTLWLASMIGYCLIQNQFDMTIYTYSHTGSVFFSCMTIALIALKIGAFPCAFWVIDIYQVSSAPTIMWLSFVQKFLMIAILGIWVNEGFIQQTCYGKNVYELFLIIGTLIGHIGAYQSSNWKKFIGYTSIAQTGFLLGSFLIRQDASLSLLYLVAYVVSLSIWMKGVSALSASQKQTWSYVAGLWLLAALPPSPLFFLKVLILQGLLQDSSLVGFSLLLASTSVIAVVYYFEWFLRGGYFKKTASFEPIASV